MMKLNSYKALNSFGAGSLPGLIGIEVSDMGEGWVEARLKIRPEILAPNGFLHAGTVVTMADTACGYGCMTSLPEAAENFSTIELKSNFLGTARGGLILARADLAHGGRTTQVWDAVVTDAQTEKTIALFRCTQMILYPRVKPDTA